MLQAALRDFIEQAHRELAGVGILKVAEEEVPGNPDEVSSVRWTGTCLIICIVTPELTYCMFGVCTVLCSTV